MILAAAVFIAILPMVRGEWSTAFAPYSAWDLQKAADNLQYT